MERVISSADLLKKKNTHLRICFLNKNPSAVSLGEFAIISSHTGSRTRDLQFSG